VLTQTACQLLGRSPRLQETGSPEGYATWRDLETAQGVPQDELNSWHAVVDPDAAGPRVYFHRVPEPKRGKNRLHLDLAVARDVPPEEYRRRIDDEADRLRQVGATKLRAVENPSAELALLDQTCCWPRLLWPSTESLHVLGDGSLVPGADSGFHGRVHVPADSATRAVAAVPGR
jgi:Glyoxalase-like domain